MDRKIFIKTTGRILILSGLAAATGYLVETEKVDTACSVSPACQKCGQFAKCKLPKAMEARQNERQ
jgi:heme A synthase